MEKTRKTILNTSKVEVNPGWLMGGNPGAVEAQEARGQDQLVGSDQLPVKSGCDQELIAAGVVFGEPIPSDPLFRSAKLPLGWSKRKTNHSMWSELVDDKGVVRASIFYKAAFYDRSAFMRAGS